MLLVDDHISQLGELDIVLEQCVGANQYVHLAFGQALLYGVLLAVFQCAHKQLDFDVETGEHLGEAGIVLRGQNLGGCHQAGLAAVVEGDEHGEQCHQCFATAHVAL